MDADIINYITTYLSQCNTRLHFYSICNARRGFLSYFPNCRVLPCNHQIVYIQLLVPEMEISCAAEFRQTKYKPNPKFRYGLAMYHHQCISTCIDVRVDVSAIFENFWQRGDEYHVQFKVYDCYVLFL